MFKLFLVISLFATSEALNLEHLNRFEPNHEYTYSFKILISSKIYGQNSTFSLSANAYILFQTFTEATLKMMDIISVSDETPNPVDEFLLENLKLPIKFYYANGIITIFYAKPLLEKT